MGRIDGFVLYAQELAAAVKNCSHILRNTCHFPALSV